MRQTPLRSETFERVSSIERRVALVENRAAVRDPILLGERREFICCENRYALVLAGTRRRQRVPEKPRRQSGVNRSLCHDDVAGTAIVLGAFGILPLGYRRTMCAHREPRLSTTLPLSGRDPISNMPRRYADFGPAFERSRIERARIERSLAHLKRQNTGEPVDEVDRANLASELQQPRATDFHSVEEVQDNNGASNNGVVDGRGRGSRAP